MSQRPKVAQNSRQQRRLGTALRENLKRRKAQAKARAEAEAAVEPPEKPHDSAGFVADKRSR